MRTLVLAAVAALVVAVPVAFGAAPPQPLPGQRIDMKVLLMAQSTAKDSNGQYIDGVYGAWRTELERAGVPFESWMPGQPLNDAVLADYGANRAKFQAVIMAWGDQPLLAPEQTALAKFEESFGIRQISDQSFPSAAHGLNAPNATRDQGGNTGQLTEAGRAAFPYLKGPVPLPPAADADSVNAPWAVFGYQATPAPGAKFTTLLTGPSSAAYLGINVRANGTEEMVETVAGNQYQIHHQLLRDGMLNWVTRGIYLGYVRNYLGIDVDDVFLADDKWNAATNVTDYDPANAIRMDAVDVADAVAWQNKTHLKLNMVYNAGGIAQFGGASDPLIQAFKTNKNQFRWVNHTLEHPNLDCATAGYISSQITRNQAAFNASIGSLAAGLNDPTELVTGEHSGLANTRPGNPGTIDPPEIGTEASGTGGTLAAGSTYEYGISATTAAGETPVSTTQVAVSADPAPAATTSKPVVTWQSICNATRYKVYRRLAGATDWSLLDTVSSTAAAVTATTNPNVTPPTAAFADAGPGEWRYTDPGTAGLAGTPPAANTAVVAPYRQNPALIPALTTAGVRTIASDSSKGYPNPVTKDPVSSTDATNFAPGATFVDGPAQTVPRYPTNVYYNVANRADQLDEYNWLYVKPANGGGCVDIPDVTTCLDAPVDWPGYLNSEATIMFGHVVGNDPRPHYFHQTNIAQYDPAKPDSDTTTGGTLYALVDTLLNRYDAAIDRDRAPLVQLSQSGIKDTLVRQNKWQADVAAGTVSGYIQDGKVHVTAPAGTDVPLTGTTVGTSYAGQKSGWTTVTGSATFDPSDPANTVAPSVTGSVAALGGTLTATPGTWSGTPTIGYSYQWQRCNAQGETCQAIAGAAASTYQTQAADKDQRLRVIVSAGNWISSYSQAASAPTGPVGQTGTIELTNKIVAAAGVPENGRFDLTVDGAVKAHDTQDGGSTGVVTVPVGKRSVGAAAGTATALGDYRSRIVCAAPGHAGTAADGTALGITVASGDQWKCTITNTRKPRSKPPTGTTPPPAGSDGGSPAAQVVLNSLRIRPKRFAVKGGHRGARVRWSVSGKAILRLTLQRAKTGRQVAGACVAATTTNRSLPACRRYVSLRTITRRAAAGAGSMKLTKRFGATRLRPGRYRLVVTAAADGSTQASAPRTVSFTVVRRAR